MNPIPCRDCGTLLAPNARGCPRCARNIEAERMIEKVFWFLIVPIGTILSGLLLWLLYRAIR